MDDIQSTLQALLDDPEQLNQLAQTAASILQSDEKDTAPALPDLSQLMKMLQGSDHSGSQKLISALAPFLSENRRTRLERASKIAHLSSIAEIALGRELERG